MIKFPKHIPVSDAISKAVAQLSLSVINLNSLNVLIDQTGTGMLTISFIFNPLSSFQKPFCANYTLRFSSNTYFLSNWASSLYKIFEGFMSLCFKNLTICCTTIGCTQCTHSLCGQLRNQHKWIEKAFSNYMTSTSNPIEKFLAFVVCTRQNFWRI